MAKADALVNDGTFEKCPHEFGKNGQMYNIWAYLGTEGVTVVHAFLPNKFKGVLNIEMKCYLTATSNFLGS